MISKNLLDRINSLIEDETIFRAKVCRLGRVMVGAQPMAYMEVFCPRNAGLGEPVRVRILDSDADTDENHGSLVRFLDHEIPFVLIRTDDDHVYGSRRLAQEKLKAEMLQDLQDGRCFSGIVTAVTPYGAYVDVGGVTGLLRTGDATDDHSEIGEHLKVGQPVSVKCRDITSTGRINWVCPVKYHRSGPVVLDFEEDMIVTGTVTAITGFAESGGTGVFVRVASGVDALCPLPEEFVVDRGMKVAVRIMRITPDPKNENAAPKVRGKIVRTM